MRRKFLFLVTLIPAITFAQTYKKNTAQKDRLSIQLSDGVMNIVPLSEKAIRVQWEKGMMQERKFVLINKLPVIEIGYKRRLYKVSP